MTTYAVTLTVSTYGTPVSNTRDIEAEGASQALTEALKSFGMNLSDVDSIVATKIS